MKGTGIAKFLATKYGKTVSDVKSAMMRSVVGTYRKMLKELGVSHLKRGAYFEVLRRALPVAWKIAREEQKIPTADDVFRAVTEEWPTWKTDLQAYLMTA